MGCTKKNQTLTKQCLSTNDYFYADHDENGKSLQIFYGNTEICPYN